MEAEPKTLQEAIDVQVVGGKSFHGVNYVCPACRVVLSVAIDPVALKSDLIAAIAKELGRQ
jgi:hypothetical protein